MIRVRLLGGARKAVGRDVVEITAESLPVAEMLGILKSQSALPAMLKRENLIIAINGADAASRGDSAQIRDGDEVTVVTVIHGGAKSASPYIVEKIGNSFVMVIGIAEIPWTNETAFLKQLRSLSSATVQAVNFRSVYSVGHILGAVAIALQALEDGILIANTLETEILLRLAGTNQISEAIRRAGVKPGSGAFVIALSDSDEVLSGLLKKIGAIFELDGRLFTSGKRRASSILRSMKLKTPGWMGPDQIESFLVERAAIITK